MKEKYFEFAGAILFALILLLGAYVLYPFLDILLIAIVFAYLIRPVEEKLKVKNNSLRCAVATLLILIPLLIIFSYSFSAVVRAIISQKLIQRLIFLIEDLNNIVSDSLNKILVILDLEEQITSTQIMNFLETKLQSLKSQITEYALKISFTLPQLALKFVAKFFLSGVLAFFFVRDGKGLKETLIKLAPPSKEKRFTRLVNGVDTVFYGVIVGYFLKAIVSGILAMIVFYILGFQNIILIGVVYAIFDFIPIIGPWTVTAIFSAWYFLNGDAFFALKILILAYPIVSTFPEIYVRPKISGEVAHIHPAIMLLGILGGTISLGLKGVILGPLILGVIVITVKSYYLNIEIKREDFIEKIIKVLKRRLRK